MTGSSPLAVALAEAVGPHFSRQRSHVAANEQPAVAMPPDTSSITAMADAVFWASLRREEGYIPLISLAYVSPDEEHRAIRFHKPLPLTPSTLTKIAPAVERPGIHLAAWPIDGEICVWGTTRQLPSLCFVLEVIAPGLLVVKHSRIGASGKFANVAVLEGDRIKLLDDCAIGPGECRGIAHPLLSFQASGSRESNNVLVQVAVSMRDHRHGGLLLVVPSDSDWSSSILQPIPYAVSPPFSELADLVAHHRERDQDWNDALRSCVAMLAGLTAVDGATVISSDFELLAFGAKIGRRSHSSAIEQLLVSEPVIGSEHEVINVTQLGGTRHIYAAQFIHDQRDAMALVASQDGRFTIMVWAPAENMVHAHRVEALLL